MTAGMHGSFFWNELNTHDAEAAKAFYGETLGWTFKGTPTPFGTYWLAIAGEIPVGGIFPMDAPHFAGVPNHWLAYIAVDDVDARLKKVAAAGGQVMREPMDIPDVGRFGLVKDATGAMIALITPAARR